MSLLGADDAVGVALEIARLARAATRAEVEHSHVPQPPDDHQVRATVLSHGRQWLQRPFESRRRDLMMQSRMHLSISPDDPDVGYLALPDYPGRGTAGAAIKQMRLRDLADYSG